MRSSFRYVSVPATPPFYCFFFFNDTATTEIYTLSLHDALPICRRLVKRDAQRVKVGPRIHEPPLRLLGGEVLRRADRSEEHTSELQSQSNLVCRLLLEKKKKNKTTTIR